MLQLWIFLDELNICLSSGGVVHAYSAFWACFTHSSVIMYLADQQLNDSAQGVLLGCAKHLLYNERNSALNARKLNFVVRLQTWNRSVEIQMKFRGQLSHWYCKSVVLKVHLE